MKRIAMAFCVLWALGCSGLADSALKAGGVNIDADGNVTMTLPDGSVVRTQNGGEVPEDFALPAPSVGARPVTVTYVTQADNTLQVIATYDMDRPRAEHSAVYSDWFSKHVPDHKYTDESAAGIVTELFIGEVDGQVLSVTLAEAFGSNTVSLMVQTPAPDDVATE